MTELPDDELDKLFRKSSEELDPQFDPEDWNALKKRLDQHDGKTAGGWLKKWWPLGALILLIPMGFATYFWFGGQVKNENPPTAKPAFEIAKPETKANAAQLESAPPGAAALESDSEGSAAPGAAALASEDLSRIEKTAKSETGPVIENSLDNNTGSGEEKNPRKAVSKNLKITDTKIGKTLPRSRSKAGGVFLEPERSKGEGGNGALSFSAAEVRKSDLKGTKASELGARQAIGSNGVNNVENATAGVDNAAAESNIVSADKDQRISISAALLAYKSILKQNNNVLPEIALPKPSEVPEREQPEKANEPTPQWAVRFGISPDLSTVGLKNFSKPGSAVSLLVEYALLRKLYVQTGISRSVKKYNAVDGEYIWRSKYPPKVLPDNVEGICNVLEIPLNLRYDIVETDRVRWFTSAGASSYYMQKEKYKYNYPPHTYGAKGWEGKTGWYFMSHVNASAGYEYRLSQKLSLLAEPYVRIPIKRVGYGKVNLVTAGVWISLRYTPTFK